MLHPYDLTPDGIRAQVQSYYAEQEAAKADPVITTADLYPLIEERFGGIDWARISSIPERMIKIRRFQANIRTTVNRMVDARQLHRIPGTSHNDYLTPAQYERRVRAEAEYSAVKARQLELTDKIRGELQDLGFSPVPGRYLQLSLDEWQQLTELARNGKALVRE